MSDELDLSDFDSSDFTNEKVVSLDIAAMDQLVRDFTEAKSEYEKAKEASNAAHAKMEELKGKVLDALAASGKSKYFVDGLGQVNTVTTLVVQTPKLIEEKRELFRYIREKHGDDALMGYLTINYQSLNSFVRTEIENHKEDPAFMVPGVGAPKAEKNLQFRKEKV